MTNLNNQNNVFETNLEIDLDTWGKTITTEMADEIMQHGSKMMKEAFLQMLFVWQKANQGSMME